MVIRLGANGVRTCVDTKEGAYVSLVFWGFIVSEAVTRFLTFELFDG